MLPAAVRYGGISPADGRESGAARRRDARSDGGILWKSASDSLVMGIVRPPSLARAARKPRRGARSYTPSGPNN